VPQLFCTRADAGTYCSQFLAGNYIGIGWLPNDDLSYLTTKEPLYDIYKKEYPHDTSKLVVGQQVGQISRFLFDIKAGDYVITPPVNTEFIHYGIVADAPAYFEPSPTDGCPYRHRREIVWHKKPIARSSFSVPFQNSIRSSLTVFRVGHEHNFYEVVGASDLIPPIDKKLEYDYYTSVLNRILQLDATEFEVFVTHLLSAIGFEGAEHTGKPHDGGVDATGELNVFNLAKIKVFVQAKRYQLGAKISAEVVRDLRKNIPSNGQGAFITTADFQAKATEVAVEANFPRIGLINGRQLVDILSEHWDDMPAELQEKLGLKKGLVLA
jgi:predicted Mrr-cat superfamily restriction endonuclease